ncbi:hypothetical protein Taro_020233 [Colocasia esculenta]|uniref:Uncharacterized protein n=1 Tax=Colocasia esculenta TaxID=4460 RepID=A0A843UYB2_COLES|nr:hypothetical protein [Colocasia esculenta]
MRRTPPSQLNPNAPACATQSACSGAHIKRLDALAAASDLVRRHHCCNRRRRSAPTLPLSAATSSACRFSVCVCVCVWIGRLVRGGWWSLGEEELAREEEGRGVRCKRGEGAVGTPAERRRRRGAGGEEDYMLERSSIRSKEGGREEETIMMTTAMQVAAGFVWNKCEDRDSCFHLLRLFVQKVGVCNPVMLLNEIEKTSSDARGDLASALLEIGGGRNICPGEVLESADTKAAKEECTRQLISNYKSQIGLTVDAKLKAYCETAKVWES